MKDIFLSGIQGSWKGTQADLLMKELPNQFKYFETWAILRALSWTDNAIGNYLRHTIETWWLVKDDVVVAIFNVFLQTVEPENRLLLDGVLRKIWQTEKICELMKKAGRDFLVLHFDLPDELVYERLASRIVCGKCWNNAHGWQIWWSCENCGGELIRRKDDSNIEAIQKRIYSFHTDTELWLKWLEQNGRLVHIDATRSVEEIFADVLKYVKN